MTDNELKELVAGLAVSNAELTKKMKETDAQMARTDATLERMGITLGNHTNNSGSMTEKYFYNSLKAKPYLGGVKYDFVDRNIKGNVPKASDEFNIVMYNGDSIALIECKSKAHKNDLIKLIDNKANNFRTLFPDYKDYKIYLGLASFSFYDELRRWQKKKELLYLKTRVIYRRLKQIIYKLIRLMEN